MLAGLKAKFWIVTELVAAGGEFWLDEELLDAPLLLFEPLNANQAMTAITITTITEIIFFINNTPLTRNFIIQLNFYGIIISWTKKH